MSCCRQKNSHCGCLAIREAIIQGLCRRVIRFREGSELELLGGIANARGCKLKGDIPDYPKAAVLFIDDFRSGRLGRLTLEQPPVRSTV